MKTKEFIIALVFILTSLVAYSFFPAIGAFQSVVVALVFFGILPMSFDKYVLKKNIKSFTIGDYKKGILWSAYSMVAITFILFILSYYFNLFDKYTVPIFIIGDFVNFIFYEFAVVIPFVFLYEYYFRGFIMPIFSEKFGYLAILVQTLIFSILVLSDKSGNIVQFVPYLLFAPFAGIIAYKSKSIFYSGITQFIVIFVLNIMIIKRVG